MDKTRKETKGAIEWVIISMKNQKCIMKNTKQRNLHRK